MKYLKKFNESQQSKLLREIHSHLLDIATPFYGVNRDLKSRITIHEDGTVDIVGDILIDMGANRSTRELTRLPINFGSVDGKFSIFQGLNLETLEGSPHTCQEYVLSNIDKVRDLKGSPRVIYEGFRATRSNLTSLEGCPDTIGDWFDIDGAKITSLEGCSNNIGTLDISNTLLKDLRGAPAQLDRLRIFGHELTSLEGMPRSVNDLIISNPRGRGIFDPRGLKDCKINILSVGFEVDTKGGSEPFSEIMELFNDSGTPPHQLNVNEMMRLTQIFIESLDYNYIKGPVDEPYIDLFRLKEALQEFEIEPNPHGWESSPKILKHYQFRDDRGREVDFDGNLI